MNFQISLSISTEKSASNRDFVESIDQFGEFSHFNMAKLSDPRTRDIFPFI